MSSPVWFWPSKGCSHRRRHAGLIVVVVVDFGQGFNKRKIAWKISGWVRQAVLVVFIQGLIKEIESGPRKEGHCPLYSHCNINSIRCAHLHFINSQLRVCNKHPAYYSVPTTTHVDAVYGRQGRPWKYTVADLTCSTDFTDISALPVH